MNMTRDALRRAALAKQAAKAGNLNAPEPDPARNSNPPVWPWVIEKFKETIPTVEQKMDPEQLGRYSPTGIAAHVVNDMAERHMTGIEKYGVPLQPDNGRNPLVDAYQESLDLCAYLGQWAMEQEFDFAPPILVRAMKMAYELRQRIEEHGDG